MTIMPKVTHIFICPKKGEPMQEVNEVIAIEGVGLQGDRYCSGTGTYSGKNNRGSEEVMRQVSLITEEGVAQANMLIPTGFTYDETRRNIVVGGMTPEELLRLIGRPFMIGDNVTLMGFEDCTPCELPSKLAGKAGFKDAFQGFGGLRARIVASDGAIRVGDMIQRFQLGT
jgi:hypothetical protein